MKNPRSLFRVESAPNDAPPRSGRAVSGHSAQRFGSIELWLLIAGPLLVVVASLATAWIAYRSDDGLVASDYYKRGLLINRILPSEPLPASKLAATVAFAA